MTQEQKDLLLKDLCARLPYGVIIQHPDYDEPQTLDTILTPDAWHQGGIQCQCDDTNIKEIHDLVDCKPYLRPMSSITKEEKKELEDKGLGWYMNGGQFCFSPDLDLYDWLNKNMFDYRGLIPAGQAIEVTEDNNPYKD